MPRRPDREQINCTVSAAQHQAALRQAQARGMGLCAYVRWLLAQDAEKMNTTWPDDLNEIGVRNH